MLPSHHIITCTVATLDVGHQLGRSRPLPVGAATLSSRVDGTAVRFTLDTFVLQPTDRVSELVQWLDQQLGHDEATLAGYRLAATRALLARLPGTQRSSAVRSLAGRGHQQVMDLSARQLGGAAISFQEACAHSRIICTPVDPSGRFTTWCRSDTDRIAHDLEVDAIATWRLIMRQIGERTRLGHEVAGVMNERLAAWLREMPTSAARVHLRDIEAIAG